MTTPSRLALLSAAGLPDGLALGSCAFEVRLSAEAGANAPEWIQLAPRGEVRARDGRTFLFRPEALKAVFDGEGLKLPIDFEHESEFTSTLGARPARGWIVGMEARPEGLFGRVDLLPDAVSALQAQSYRYVSPTIYLAPDRKTAARLKGAALVTAPALAMPALASATSEGPPSMNVKDLLALLGLSETSTIDQVQAAVANLKAVDPAAYAPIAQLQASQAEVTRLSAELTGLRAQAAEKRCAELVDGAIAGGKIAPAAREQYLALASADFDKTKAAIDAMPVVLKAGTDQALDRAVPGAGAAGTLSEEERAVVARLGISEEAFLKARAA